MEITVVVDPNDIRVLFKLFDADGWQGCIDLPSTHSEFRFIPGRELIDTLPEYTTKIIWINSEVQSEEIGTRRAKSKLDTPPLFRLNLRGGPYLESRLMLPVWLKNTGTTRLGSLEIWMNRYYLSDDGDRMNIDEFRSRYRELQRKLKRVCRPLSVGGSPAFIRRGSAALLQAEKWSLPRIGGHLPASTSLKDNL